MASATMNPAANIVQGSFTIHYAPLRDVLSHEQIINESLHPSYFPATIVDVSTGDVQEKGFVSVSEHGHSQVVVSSARTVLTVSFSPEWQKDYLSGSGYMKERASLLFDIAEGLSSRILFCGAVVTLHLRSAENLDNVATTVADTLSLDLGNDLYDVLLRHTNVVDGRFFTNVTVKNYRTWNLSFSAITTPRLSRSQAIERGVEIVSDVNNRFAFNEGIDFQINRTNHGDLIDRAFDRAAEYSNLF